MDLVPRREKRAKFFLRLSNFIFSSASLLLSPKSNTRGS